jgi:hypothetical protein
VRDRYRSAVPGVEGGVRIELAGGAPALTHGPRLAAGRR